MARAGIRKIDEIVGPDGSRHPIQCNLGTGVFIVKILDGNKTVLQRFDGKDLEKVRADATEWIRGNVALEWLPILVISSERGCWNNSDNYEGSEGSIDLDYERYFRAIRKDGGVVYKEFAKPLDPKDPTHHLVHARKDDMDCVPGKEVRCLWGDESKVLEYTQERWSALRMISVMIRSLNERIHGLIEGGTFDAFLLTLVKKGAGMLLEGPKEGAKEAQKKEQKEKAHA